MRCFDEKTAPQRVKSRKDGAAGASAVTPGQKRPLVQNPVLSRRLHPVWPQQKHDASDQAAEIGFAIATARPRRSDRADRRHSLIILPIGINYSNCSSVARAGCGLQKLDALG